MVDSPVVPAGHFTPIGLDTMDAVAALRNRVDTKYVIARHALGPILDDLRFTGLWSQLTIGADSTFVYSNIYFDHDLMSFRHHVQRRHRRFKIRSRQYPASANTQLELKVHSGRGRTIKERRVRNNHTATLNDAEYAWVVTHLDRHGLIPHHAHPRTTTFLSYQRITLVAPSRGERITIDTDVTATGQQGATSLLPDAAVIEVKSPEHRGPTTELLLRHGHRPQSYSKYCAAIAVNRYPCYLPARDAVRRLRRHDTPQ